MDREEISCMDAPVKSEGQTRYVLLMKSIKHVSCCCKQSEKFIVTTSVDVVNIKTWIFTVCLLYSNFHLIICLNKFRIYLFCYAEVRFNKIRIRSK